MKGYIKELSDKGLIKKENSEESISIIITKKGREFFLQYSRMKEFEDTFGL